MSACGTLVRNTDIDHNSFVHLTKMPANTAIADISDFWPSKKPANTAIADFADISDIWATMGGICRHAVFLWESHIW